MYVSFVSCSQGQGPGFCLKRAAGARDFRRTVTVMMTAGHLYAGDFISNLNPVTQSQTDTRRRFPHARDAARGRDALLACSNHLSLAASKLPQLSLSCTAALRQCCISDQK